MRQPSSVAGLSFFLHSPVKSQQRDKETELQNEQNYWKFLMSQKCLPDKLSRGATGFILSILFILLKITNSEATSHFPLTENSEPANRLRARPILASSLLRFPRSPFWSEPKDGRTCLNRRAPPEPEPIGARSEF